MSKLFTAISVCFIALSCFGGVSSNPRPMTFGEWKDVQRTRAQNQVVRLGNRITTLKRTTGDLQQIRSLESAQRVAAKNVEIIGDLSMEDYFNIYLSQYANKDAALQKAVRAMSRQEMAALLKSLLRSKSKLDTAYYESTSSILSDLTRRQNL